MTSILIGSSKRGTLMHTISFFFNDTATTEIYTLSLHDALPISQYRVRRRLMVRRGRYAPYLNARTTERPDTEHIDPLDRKSTRLNSSHGYISYAVFCLKKKKRHNADTSRATTNKPHSLPNPVRN